MPKDKPIVVETREDLCLGFANTRYWRGSAEPTETLNGFADLVGWLRDQANVQITGPEIIDWALKRPAEAAAIFHQAIAIREAIYGVFTAVASQSPIDGSNHLGVINKALELAPKRNRLVPLAGGYGWEVSKIDPAAPSMLVSVLWSASDLLTQVDHSRIRCCANESCRWIFVDRSKAGTRRWCDMSSCGNRAKSRRHYARSRQG